MWKSEATIRHIATSLLGKRLSYLYPEVIHHPNQAYVALEPEGEQYNGKRGIIVVEYENER